MQLSVWPTSSPGPTESSRFSISDKVPPFRRDSTPETIWYDQASDSTPIFLTPNSQTVRPPDEIEFTFVNNSHQKVGGTMNEWQVYKRRDGEWYPLKWKHRQAVGPSLLPGQTETWALRTYHDGVVHDEEKRKINLGHLGSGTYAFAVHWTASDADHHQAYATPFRIEGHSISIEPQESVSVHHEDRTIVVEPSRTDSSESQEFELRGASSADTLLLPEQVMQLDVLRNTLPFFDDETDRVLLGTESSWPFPGSTFRFEFQGQSFELSKNDAP
jgi:virulence-associated protein VagC